MAHLSDYRTTDWLNRRPWLALVLSLLLHGLLIVILLLQPWAWNRTTPEPQILAEFVLPPPPPAAPAPAARRPAEPEIPPLPPASTPQLQRAPVTEESRAQPGPGERARNQQQSAPQPSPLPAPDQRGPNRPAARQQQGQQSPSERQAGSGQAGPGRAAGPPGPAMTQSESDFFLSQVVAAWAIDFDAPQFRNIQIFGHYKVLPDGTLAPPFGRNDPWDLHAMVNNWEEIENEPRAAAFRTAIETFLRAMRLAQPFEMPPDAQGYPKILSLNFRIGDL